MTPFYSAVCWFSGYLALVLAPLLVLLIGPMPPGLGFWLDFSMALGFAGIAVMGVQFLLSARFRRASAPFGIDIIYYFHRYMAVFALALIFLHFLVIRISNPEILGPINPLRASWHMSAGRISFVLFALLIATSLWRKRLHIPYDEWRISHIILSVTAFLLALWHIEGVGFYIDAPAKHWLWISYTLFWLLLIVYVRLIKPWQMYKRPYRVAEVRQECCNSWTLTLTPEGHEGMRFQPGQFAWLTLRKSPWQIKEHPFSFSSSAAQHDRLEFTIKELGDFTRTIKETRTGEKAYLSGPYGVFSIDQYPKAPGFVFIAGGVGAAPIMSMLRTLADRHDQRPLWFIYCNNHLEDVVFRVELENLKQRLHLSLTHVVAQPPPDWKGESGFISQQLLQKLLPDDAGNYEYFLCAPKPMSDVVQQALHSLEVPLARVHYELFDLV